MLEDPKCVADHAKIIKHLKNFIYDTQSMTMLCQRESFINFVIFQIQSFLKDPKNMIECSIKYTFSSDKEMEPLILDELNSEEGPNFDDVSFSFRKNFFEIFF